MNTSTKESLIIDRPERQGTLRRIVQGSLTLGLWLAWLYLLLPVFEPALALAGVDLTQLGVTHQVVDLQPFVLALTLVASVMVGFWLWARYNVLLYRFRDKVQERLYRVGHDQLADSFGICPESLSSWQRSGQLVIRLTEQGSICSVETTTPKVVSLDAQRKAAQAVAGGETLLDIPRAS